jgi:hypothetical protein
MNPIAEPFGRRPFSLGLLALAVLTAVYHAPVLWGGQAYVFVDASRFFYPIIKWGSGVWGTGHLPLWNPDMDCGVPYWADPQMACAYLPTWLLYGLFPPILAFNAAIAFHQFWAAAGFFTFARERGWSVSASLASSVAFGFSLHVTCSSWTPVALAALSWIPWVFLAGEGIWKGKTWAWGTAPVCIALQMAAGYPVVAYLTALCLWVYLVFQKDSFKKERVEWTWKLASATLLAVLYNLSWGLPFAEYFALTNHGQEAAGYYQALHWDDLWTWITPFPKGNPVAGGYHGIHYWVATFFMGWMVPLLLIWRLARGKGSPQALVLWVLGLWLSLGETGFLGGELKGILPGYHLVIRSGFWIGLVVFWAAYLVAEALTDLESLPRRGMTSVVWVLGILSILSLLPSAWAVRFSLPDEYYREPAKILSMLPKDGRFLHSPKVLVSASWLGGEDAASAYQVPKERLYPNWPLVWGRSCAFGYNTIGFRVMKDWQKDAFKVSPFVSRSVLDFLRVRYLFGAHRFPGLTAIGFAETLPVSENPAVLPAWFCARDVRPSGDWADDGKIMDAAHKGLDRMVFVESLGWSGPADVRSVRVEKSTPTSWELEVGDGGRAILVSSEAAAPGWKVWVDDQERKPLTVQQAFRGLELLPVDRRVRWVYAPTSFRLGLFLGLMAVAFWAGCFIVWARVRETCRWLRCD